MAKNKSSMHKDTKERKNSTRMGVIILGIIAFLSVVLLGVLLLLRTHNSQGQKVKDAESSTIEATNAE